MNSHLLTQEEKDYFISLYREYNISFIDVEDYGVVSIKGDTEKLGMDKILELQIEM